ncbi:MAG: hypothetical protein M1609_08795 [Firmicutes bacterium]|nr:hypothetical protein [Bacillota bacterium]
MFTGRIFALKIAGLTCSLSLIMAVTGAGPSTKTGDKGPPPQAPGTIYSNQSTYTRQHENVYINGTGMARRQYKISFYDSGNFKVGTTIVHANEDGSFREPAAYAIKGSESPGLWRAEAVHGNETEASCTFTVLQSAIPEFPTVLAGILVSGMCALIYHWLRKKRSPLAT